MARAELRAETDDSGDVASALAIYEQMERVRRGSSQAREVRAAAQAKLLRQLNSPRRAGRALEVAPRLSSPAVNEAIARLIADPAASDLFDKAVDTLASIDEPRTSGALATAFQSGDAALRHRAAWRLWRMNRSALVEGYIRSDIERRLSQTTDAQEAQELARELVSMGYEAARPQLAQLVSAGISGAKSESVAAAVYTVWRGQDPQSADAVALPALADASEGRAAFPRCGRLELALVDGVSNADPRPVDLVRALFGRSVEDQFTSSCGREILRRLDAIDPADWSGVPISYNGWTIFGTMIGGRIDDLRMRNQRTAQIHYESRRWALTRTPELAERLRQFMLQWGTWDAFSGGVDTYVRFQRADFTNPRRARLIYHVNTEWNGPPVGRIVVGVEASGAWSEQPWTIVEVVETVRL